MPRDGAIIFGNITASLKENPMSTVEQKARDVVRSVLQNQSLFGRSAVEAQMAFQNIQPELTDRLVTALREAGLLKSDER
jgi:DNA-binding IscR family transcriptional regulator